MRNTLTILAVASLFTGFALAQTGKTFYFTQPMSEADLEAGTVERTPGAGVKVGGPTRGSDAGAEKRQKFPPSHISSQHL